MASRLPRTLYHYCSVPTFYNIIKNKSIWLSDISKSNDSLELRWIKGKCQYYMLKAWTDYVKATFDIGESGKVDFAAFESLQKQVENLFSVETEKCWAFCLSEKADDLGQWRGYADDGCGISIGFKSSFFRTIEAEGKSVYKSPSSVTFDSVSYKDKEVEKLFYDTCGLSQITPHMGSNEVLRELHAAILATLLLAPFYKSRKFAEEKEWRLVFSTETKELIAGKTPQSEFKKMFPSTEIQYDFIVRNNWLVSHISFGAEDLAKHISEIWIGPKCKLSSIDLRLFLISFGFLKDIDDKSIAIHKSQASYR